MALDNRQLTQLSLSQAGAGSVTISVADAGGVFLKIVSMFLVADTDDQTIQFFSGATALSGAMPFKKGGGIGARGTVQEPLIETVVAGADFVITSVGGGLKGWLSYYIDNAA